MSGLWVTQLSDSRFDRFAAALAPNAGEIVAMHCEQTAVNRQHVEVLTSISLHNFTSAEDLRARHVPREIPDHPSYSSREHHHNSRIGPADCPFLYAQQLKAAFKHQLCQESYAGTASVHLVGGDPIRDAPRPEHLVYVMHT